MDIPVVAAIEEARGRKMALATIIRATGSTPRHEGTGMLVFEDGAFSGTVGGGSGEERIRQAALGVIREERSARVVITLNDDVALREGMICGGTMETYIEYLRDPRFHRAAAARVAEGGRALLVTDMVTGAKALLTEEATVLLGEDPGVDPGPVRETLRTGRLRVEGDRVLDPCLPPERLFVFGGGHVSIPVCRLAASVDFAVCVVDDRPEFANARRFAEADRVVCHDLETVVAELSPDENSYALLLTRGHTYDRIILRQLLSGPWKYIGMIGSRRRVSILIEGLAEEGYDRDRLAAVHTPVGIPIGAETPEEIAVSIVAQLVAVRRGTAED